MTPILKLTNNQYEEIISYFAGSKEERVVFGLLKSINGKLFLLENFVCVPEDGMSKYSVELTESMQARLIKWAWDNKGSLVEMHSHPFSNKKVQFSSYDLEQFKIFVPHVHWRLKNRPYFALVFGQNDFDALAWIKNPNDCTKLKGLSVESKLLEPTNLTYNAKHKRRWLWWMK